MANPHATYQLVRSHLAFLRLGAAAEALAPHLDDGNELSHIEFLERLLRVEVDATAARRHASLLRFACFPAPWRIEDFDFDAQPAVDRKLVEELLTLRFIEDAGNVLLIGPRSRQDHARPLPGPRRRRRRLPRLLNHRRRPGRPLPPGRTGRPLGLRHAVLLRPLRPDRGRGGLPAHAGRSSRRPVPGRVPPLPQGLHRDDHQPLDQQLGQIFDDPMVAAAMLDRLLHRSTVLHIDGDSYRMRAHQQRTDKLRAGAKPTRRR